VNDVQMLFTLPDDELLERLGEELWGQSTHATPATPQGLRAEARAWLKANLPKAREAVCSSSIAAAFRENRNEIALAGGIADLFAASLGFPAPSVVAILIVRIGLDRLCGEREPERVSNA
jgi:hypothetical protein